MKFTPEDLEKLQTKQLANVIRKLNAGKTLTAREQQMLDDARAQDNPPPNESPLNFVRNWDDLAQSLGVSRKSVQNWRAREDLRSAPDFPRPRADGRHDVEAWRRFMIAHGLNRADELVDADEVPNERKTIRDWKEYREQLQCQEIERRIARGDNLLLVATELEIPLGATFVAIQTKLSQFPARFARFMVMRRDEAEAEAMLQDQMDAVLADLNAADYLDDAVDAIAAEFPFDEETADLYAKVSFGGQDRDAFVRLIACATRQALRRIGRMSIAPSSSSSLENPSLSRDSDGGTALTCAEPLPANEEPDRPPKKRPTLQKRPRFVRRKNKQ
ncbi:MAG TPA: hypothetical protein VHW03_09940 [Chthoniobacterales bacterium]|nr:hypothetical protein [Chthoniobacterales bacterium]